MAIITYVDILVINLVGIRNHLAYTRPVARETSVHSENVDPLEPVESDRRRLKKLGILSETLVEPVPSLHDRVVLFLGFEGQSGILQPLQILVLPVREDVRISRPHFDHLVVLALFLLLDFPEDERVEDVVFAIGGMLAEY